LSERAGALPLGDRATQAILIAAALAAVLILVSVFGDYVRIGCLVVIALATVITAPVRRGSGGGWWSLLAAGAAASIAGAALAQVAETVGGLIAVIGGVLVVVGVTIGFPLREYE
jgi:hypothetical protein